MYTILRPNRYWLLIVSALFISLSIFSQKKLPVTWQPGMKLSMSYGGGMRYYSYKLQISDTGSFFIENTEGKITNYILELNKKDLDSLLQFLNRKHFASIETEMTGPVYDKGTETISLVWGDQYVGAGESYGQAIADKYKDDYNAIGNYIDALRDRTKTKVRTIPGQESPD